MACAIVSWIWSGVSSDVFGFIKATFLNMFLIHSNYEELQENETLLLDLKQRLADDDDDELQRRLPMIQVRHWLDRVARWEEDIHSVQSTMTARNGNTTEGSSCFLCSFNCILSNKIQQGLVDARGLIEEGRGYDNKIVGVNPTLDPVERILGPSIKGQSTAERNLAKLMNLLKNNENAKKIGVWGMGGVGKTTLVKNLNNELSKHPTNQLFSIVIWVTVSQKATVESIQSKIAQRLCFPNNELQGMSKESVARRLCKKLEGKRFLLILDDMWEKIDMDDVGIPRLEDNGSKIILTTRKLTVCQQMETHKDIPIGRLSEDEAWKLFSEKAEEEVVNDGRIRPLAEQIVKECGGLPLALIIVGASLRKKTEIALWNEALRALQKADPNPIERVEEEVYKHLKWSYDSLEDKCLKSCFLFFCLFPEDFEVDIDSLVPYWLAEDLLDQQQNYEQLYDRCIAIVHSLKDSCLLESGCSKRNAKMHDVVRDVGIWIAKSSNENWCKSFIRAGVGQIDISLQQLSECSNGTKRISFMNNNVASLPDREVLRLKASTLLLQGNRSLRKVPNSFLQRFPKLRILDLSETNIKSLPRSLLQLGELRALILRRCYNLSELPPSMTALGMLQVLDCSRCGITKLPGDFEKLTNLRQLDLSNTYRLKEIPIEKISKLCSLEFLNTVGGANRWGMRKTDEENLPLEKLLCLDKLFVLCVEFEDVPHITSQHVSWPGRINNFYVHFGRGILAEYDSYLSNRKLVAFDEMHFLKDDSVGWFLVNASECKIKGCRGVDVMLGNMVSIGPFANLKVLKIVQCFLPGKMSSVGQHVTNFDLLPNLENLYLEGVTELKSLTDLRSFLGLNFSKLKCIVVGWCPQLENLLTVDGTLQKLEEMETIKIERCGKLTEVFKNASSDDTVVPNLRSLILRDNRALERICSVDIPWNSLKKIVVRECPKLRKMPRCIQNAESIQSIEGERDWWNRLQWDSGIFKERLQPHFTSNDDASDWKLTFLELASRV